ncbi:hypothetical protein FOL46_000384 [Perkinsus olseni]|uniref:Uncharacterized protein n=1 Tax=Perkinsus olseni TaxID=32597 RepID=A0A7J6KVH8_PEROL|nr:hypothetical protein FOL46_000384 [Perkinsus olseni]
MAFSGKDCKLLLEKVDAIEGELSQFPKGIEACGITRAAKQVREALMSPNSDSQVQASIEKFGKEYVAGGCNPSLVIHLLVVHGAELYAPYSNHGLGLLTEELAERIHSQVNIVIKRSQLKDDLLKQLSLWNWQHAPEPDEADRESLAVSTTPPLEELATKRARKPLRRSPQVAEWLPASGVSGVSSATGSKSASSEYVDLSGDDEEN